MVRGYARKGLSLLPMTATLLGSWSWLAKVIILRSGFMSLGRCLELFFSCSIPTYSTFLPLRCCCVNALPFPERAAFVL